MAALMMQKAYPGDATVTVCHSRSKDLVKECREADIIIAALGQPNFVKAEMVKEGAVVIDVGTTRVPDASKKSGFKLTGDVKFDEVSPKCSFITPVPGGVGPMTIVSLMKIHCWQVRRRSINNPLLRFPLHRRGNGEFAFQYLSIMNTIFKTTGLCVFLFTCTPWATAQNFLSTIPHIKKKY